MMGCRSYAFGQERYPMLIGKYGFLCRLSENPGPGNVARRVNNSDKSMSNRELVRTKR
jgi:hypothetical protein